MLDSLKKPPGSLRWPPRQKFSASDAGKDALAKYQEEVSANQGTHRGRDGLEKLQKEWAEAHHVMPTDAMVLGEFVGKDRPPREVHTALSDCGLDLRDVQMSIDRLYLAGLLTPAGGGGPIPPGSRNQEQE